MSCSCGASASGSGLARLDLSASFAENQYITKLKSAATTAKMNSSVSRLNGRVVTSTGSKFAGLTYVKLGTPPAWLNELWISNMNGWETIVLDLNKLEVKGYIPTPNGGDTHSGGFARYTPDWKGELLADMGGPKAAMRDTMRQRAAAAQKSAAATPAAASLSTG